jgi:hypothetical protein
LVDLTAFGPTRTEYDPALLAFIKCHLTSFTRWDALRFLAEAAGRWNDAGDVARAIHRPLPAVAQTLQELAQEDLIDCQAGPDGPAFRLDPGDPSCRVVHRLVDTARESRELRQLIVARVVRETATPSFTLIPQPLP